MKKYFPLAVGVALLLLGLSQILFTPKNLPEHNNQQPQVLSLTPQILHEATDAPQNILDNSQAILVTKVIDGDTIELEGGQRVRYIGVDTPETVDPRKPVQCFGQEASAKNKQLVEGKVIRLEKDISETDKYGRLLRYVYVDDIFVNEYLVEEGFARASTYPPDVKYQDKFRKSEESAQTQNRGLWSSCGSNQQVAQTPSGCIIKGNISSSGEKIYHLPGQKYYDQTVIDTSKGEKFFCSEAEAVSAGWRKSKL